MSPSARLSDIAQILRRRRLLSGVALTLPAALLLGPAVGHFLGATALWQTLVAGIVIGSGVAIIGFRDRWHPIDAHTVARHVNRRVDAMQESTELLLDDESWDDPLLVRLQRARMTDVFGQFDLNDVVPRQVTPRGLAVVVSCGLVAGALFVVPPLGPPLTGVPGVAMRNSTVRTPMAPPFLRSSTIEIVPPKYTGLSVRRTDDLDLDVEERARVTWQLGTNRAVSAARLVGTDGFHLPLQRTGTGWTAHVAMADRSLLYRVELLDGDSVAFSSEDHRLTVRPDAAPVIALVHPEIRTTVPFTGPMVVPVEIVVRDDYGADSVTMPATITSGSGEGVKFRRVTLAFGFRAAQGPAVDLLRATLDLRAIGLRPGDELYFYVEATDRRPGTPNRSRSETVFLTVPDTAQAPPADFAGLTLTLPPEYFRSQRQVIIDTELLVAERQKIPTEVFRDRGNSIGIDQGLLRLRYGQFLGDEFEEGGSPVSSGEAPAKGAPIPPRLEPPPPVDPAAEFTHEHDSEENATLLGRAVKTKLKEAVSEMWQAELYLRTARPTEALPYEYRALALLKEIQQDARTYVKRIGFEPPPLEPDRKRLAGDLSKIFPTSRTMRAQEAPTLPAVRHGLATVLALSVGQSVDAAMLASLEAAGQEVARLAVDQPPLLPLLRDVRRLIDALQKQEACSTCLAKAEQAFRHVLPEPGPLPAARAGAAGTLGARYREELTRGRSP